MRRGVPLYRVGSKVRTFPRGMTPVLIDGRTLEGGGQLVRNGAALACLMSVPVQIENVRGGRQKPGLQAQHLTGLRLVTDLAGAHLVCDGLRAHTLSIIPQMKSPADANQIVADCQTAGSISLLLQVALPVAMFGRQQVGLVLKGGSNVSMAPQWDYMADVFLPTIRRLFDVHVRSSMVRRGFYPRGQGQVDVAVPLVGNGGPLKAFTMVKRGDVTKIAVRIIVSSVKHRLPDLSAQLVDDVLHELQRAGAPISHYPVEVETDLSTAAAAGYTSVVGVLAVAHTSEGCLICGSSLREDKKMAPRAVAEAARQAVAELKTMLSTDACVDDYLQDQLILFMALAEGTSSLRCRELTMHTRTGIFVCEKLTSARFRVIPDGSDFIIECDGIGWKTPE
ncbi:RNA 3'-terminal-phosphate cyclase (ATP) [Plasmodiophora brassicae]|nr:hypothetical protein PBRA_006127 [Plasmodiophora brassicae]